MLILSLGSSAVAVASASSASPRANQRCAMDCVAVMRAAGSFCKSCMIKSLASDEMLSHSGEGKSKYPCLTEAKISWSDSP